MQLQFFFKMLPTIIIFQDQASVFQSIIPLFHDQMDLIQLLIALSLFDQTNLSLWN